MTSFDECWKEALRLFLEWFLAYFFPQAHQDIEWQHDPETLNVELEKILPENQVGRRYADKLFRVVKKGTAGDSRLLHVEVQCQVDEDFERRIHVYNYRTDDCYNHPPVSFVLLGDTNPAWRPQQYRFAEWGCVRTLEFPSVKLLDRAGHEEELLEQSNPFALLVVAHLQARHTAEDHAARQHWKVRLLRRLRQLPLEGDDFRHWVRFFSYLLELPAEREQVWQEVRDTREEGHMLPKSYLETLMEQEGREIALALGRKEGRDEGLKEGHDKGLKEGLDKGLQRAQAVLVEAIEALLEVKFGVVDPALRAGLRQQSDLDFLQRVQRSIKEAGTLEDVRRLLP